MRGLDHGQPVWVVSRITRLPVTKRRLHPRPSRRKVERPALLCVSHATRCLLTTYCLQWWGYEYHEGRDNAGHSGAFLVVRTG